MKFLFSDIVFQEVPNEISLAFFITGCPLRCQGCHSPELRNKNLGNILTDESFKSNIEGYKNYITCVLFMGGEWEESELKHKLTIIKEEYPNLKTCLYTGEKDVSNELKELLTYLKTGEYNENFGGLDKLSTNQNFINIQTSENLNHLFRTSSHDSTNSKADRPKNPIH
jgi:anaerobic ribonucleoside-triphosphate reductase activating protein